jgi:hypothetical protein
MVAYLICFDLSKSLDEQSKQLKFWLKFLNSALPLPQSNSTVIDTAKWIIILVGLKSDCQESPELRFNSLDAWRRQFPRLPILPQLFYVSALKSEASVMELKAAIERECERIFSNHTAMIPTTYRTILQELQSPHNHPSIHQDELLTRYPNILEKADFRVALQYLHAIGRIVVLKSGRVYPDAKIATHTAAKFVSPTDVSRKLLDAHQIQILDQDQIGYLLNINNSNTKEYARLNCDIFE